MPRAPLTLTVLGSGTMMPTRRRYPSGYLLRAGPWRILLDCGHLALARLVEERVDLHAIHVVCISHFHTDHFSGVLPLVHARWVDDVLRERVHRRLTVLGPQSLAERFRALRAVSWPEPAEEYPVQFLEGARRYRIGGVTITSFPVRHVPWFPSVGFRISVGRKSLVYTGDLGSRQDPGFERELRGASALLIEAGTTKRAPSHFTVEEAVALAQRCGIRRVLLTHVRDEHLPVIRRAIRGLSRVVTVVEDGQRIAL